MRNIAVLAVLLVLPAAAGGMSPRPPGFGQGAAARAFRLTDIRVDGARRFAAPDVIKLSKLTIGQQVTPAQLDEAAGRMTATGLFRAVSYRYLTLGTDLSLTLEIQEADWTVPVIFDNFVWLTDEEITAAVRQAVPLFDGVAPSSAEFPDLMLATLQDLLRARGIQGRASFLPLTDLKTGTQQYVFQVRDPSPRLCDIRIEGASALTETEVAAAARAALPDDYSRVRLTSVANGTLRDLYRQRGHWRAAFSGPAVSLERTANCSGVAATLRVDEGPAFVWAGAQWAGNAAKPSASLDAALGMKPGELASLARLEAGLRSLRYAYGRQGYVLQEAAYAANLDDERRRAVFEIRIVEGPQFNAGSVELQGLPDAMAKTLLERWRLRTGDVYDAEYPSEFVEREVMPVLRRGGAPLKRPSIDTRVDEERRVVDVRIVFK